MSCSPEQAVRTRLLADPATGALIASRLYPNYAPQNPVLPFGVQLRAEAAHEHHLSGASGLAAATVEITWHAATYASLIAVARAARLVLHGWAGTVHGESGDLIIGTITLDEEKDLPEPPEPAAEQFERTRIQRFIVWHRELVTAF
jgi:hypothetical protein